MANSKIVDAVSVPVAGPHITTAAVAGDIGGKYAETAGVSVPLSLDAASSAAMAQMMQQMAASQSLETQYRNVNPADVIHEAGERMKKVYEQFEALQELGRQLNGKATADQLPASLVLDDIKISFRTQDDAGQLSTQKVAVIKNVSCVGDIARLLSTEIGIIILTLQQEISDITTIAQKADEHYLKMRKAWEAANPDAVIKPIGEAAAAQTPAVETIK
jgi:hypothetical protein